MRNQDPFVGLCKILEKLLRETSPEYEARMHAQRVARHRQRMQQDAAYRNAVRKQAAEKAKAKAQAEEDASLRDEVIQALCQTGVAKHVAIQRTNTEAKLLTEAKNLEII